MPLLGLHFTSTSSKMDYSKKFFSAVITLGSRKHVLWKYTDPKTDAVNIFIPQYWNTGRLALIHNRFNFKQIFKIIPLQMSQHVFTINYTIYSSLVTHD